MRGSFRLGRILGIEIGIHYTWVLALVLIAWSLAEGFFPQGYEGWSKSTYWITGIVASLLLFGSVLLHEIAHSLVAKSRGLPVKNIVLFIFGGVSNIAGEPKKPMIEFVMAVVGPLTSLALGGIFWAIHTTTADSNSPVAAVVFYLALVNVLLGAFNFLPGFPLDGGRVLRSVLWGATGDEARATSIAGNVGRLLGWAMIAYGLFLLLNGVLLGGIWIAFIGWFLSNAAEAARQDLSLREHLRGEKVKELMDASPEIIGPSRSIQDLVQETFFKGHRRAAPVYHGDRLEGIVTLTDIKKVPQNRWAETPVEQIMTRQPLHTVTPDDDMASAMRLMAENDLNQLLVIRPGETCGMLSRADIIRHLQSHMKPVASDTGKPG